MPDINYVIFDLAEVLLTGIAASGKALARQYHLPSSPLMLPIVWQFFHGEVSEDAYIDEILRAHPQLGSRDELKCYIRKNFTEVEGTREIILRLKELGYPLALLSVHAEEWIVDCNNRFDHHRLFDVVAYSYLDKVSKPDHRSFNFVIGRLGARPEHCLFIDDSLPNVLAARELGMQSIQFVTAKQLKPELEKLLPDFK
ncbi:MAG: hypothetical protein A2048_10915 [Deltaproteobacteria bacterium GWA2_45_12]|nr:MAG: hypothetical protein A2048_10915 [Deltaproteobacteria bacterium GWA2_45_12]